jgi:hypothetical protein
MKSSEGISRSPLAGFAWKSARPAGELRTSENCGPLGGGDRVRFELRGRVVQAFILLRHMRFGIGLGVGRV